MPPFLSEVLGQIKKIWAQLNGAQKFNVAVVLAATLVGMGAMIYFGSRPDYVSFTAFPEGDVKAVLKALDKSSIEFRTDNDRILIDRKDLGRAKTVITREFGFSSGDGGSGSGDFGGVMEGKEARKFRLDKKARQEVERQILMLDGVNHARITWNNPPRSAFMRSTSRSRQSAAVTIGLSSRRIFLERAPNVVDLVAGGLGVPRDRIKVLSKRGDRYPSGLGASGGGSHWDHLSFEQEQSDRLSSMAQMALEPIFPGKTHVQVHVSLESTIESSERIILPPDPVKISEKKTKSKSSNIVRSARGSPSIGSTLQGGVANASSNLGVGTESIDTTTETKYVEKLGVSKTLGLTPKIELITVSLSIDDSISDRKDDIIALVKGAIGWDKDRDEAITALVTDFPAEPAPVEASFDLMGNVKQYGPIAAQVLSILLVLMFLKGLLKKTRPIAVGMESAGRTNVDDVEENPSKHAKRMRREIERAVSQDPGSVSKLLEGWLVDSSVED